MTTRQELLDYWQRRLADSEHAGGHGFAWTDRLRLKLYRFLLAMYGPSEWPGSKDDVDNEIGRTLNSSLMVADASEISTGKAPRTRAEILSSLRSVKGLSDELAPPGPLQNGLEPDSPVVVLTHSKRTRVLPKAKYLAKVGIPVTLKHSGSLWQILVAARDSAEATEALREYQQPTPQPPRPRTILPKLQMRISFAYAIFFGGVGFLLTMVVIGIAGETRFSSSASVGSFITALNTITALAFAFDMLCVMALCNGLKWRNRERTSSTAR